ncbi:glycosyltransferase, partial [Roseateles sp. GG27B]
FFANRGLEPIYRPERVITAFAAIAAQQPTARLVVANDGSLLPALQRQVLALGLTERVSFVGRLDARSQAGHYARARWYLSLPESDSVSVSVLEAMAHGCVPLLSDLPANRELLDAVDAVDAEVGDARGVIVDLAALDQLPARLSALDAEAAGRANRAWVAQHGLFGPAVQLFLVRLTELAELDASR